MSAPEEGSYLSAYRIMWMVVMFDLPVDTKAARKAATKFREHLLDLGFEMTQFSVYARFCNGREQFDAYTRKIAASLPKTGDVHILHFTDKQYENIIRFSGRMRESRREKPGQLALF
jgi:CRISPR-associated protein Cas2